MLIVITGPSGCGKSTLLFIIAGLLSATDGKVFYKDKIITEPDINRGVVFQEDAVFPWLTVRKNIEYGPRQLSLPKKVIKNITDKYLKIVGLEQYENLWPKQLLRE